MQRNCLNIFSGSIRLWNVLKIVIITFIHYFVRIIKNSRSSTFQEYKMKESKEKSVSQLQNVDF